MKIITFYLGGSRSIYSPSTLSFCWSEGLKSCFLLIAIIKNKYLLYNIKRGTNISCTVLMKDKYVLQNINGDRNIIGLYKNFILLGI